MQYTGEGAFQGLGRASLSDDHHTLEELEDRLRRLIYDVETVSDFVTFFRCAETRETLRRRADPPIPDGQRYRDQLHPSGRAFVKSSSSYGDS